MANAIQGRIREVLGEEQKKSTEVADEVDVIQNMLRKAANDLAQTNSEISVGKNELTELRYSLVVINLAQLLHIASGICCLSTKLML